MKTVAVISFTNLDTDPRVNRQIRFLCNHYHVIAFGMRSPGIDGVRFVPLTFPRLPFLPRKRWKMMRRILRLTRNFEKYYWNLPDPRQTTEILRQYRFDLILANDIDSLPAALEGAQGAKVVFDAHEYAPLEFEDQLSFRLFYQKYNEYLCNTYIPKTDAMLTVGPRIAEQYEEDTGVKPVVITNAPEYENLEPTLLKEGKPIRLVHHGGAIKSRKIEKMIRMMDSLDERFELSLLLVAPPGKTHKSYMEKLKKMADERPRVHILPAVPMRDLASFLNAFDIGVYILEPGSFNNLYALPNKIFEFIQARLATAIGPSPEMARIVQEHDCGLVAKDFTPESLAECLQELSMDKINYFKQQSHRNARTLSAETNRERLLKLVGDVLQGG